MNTLRNERECSLVSATPRDRDHALPHRERDFHRGSGQEAYDWGREMDKMNVFGQECEWCGRRRRKRRLRGRGEVVREGEKAREEREEELRIRWMKRDTQTTRIHREPNNNNH